MTHDHTTLHALTDAGMGERIDKNRRISRREVLVECGATTWRQQGDALYNLNQDPAEKNNLASAHPEKVRELKARLDAFERELEKTPSRRERPLA